MGQVFSGSHGSWVTRSDPLPTLPQDACVAAAAAVVDNDDNDDDDICCHIIRRSISTRRAAASVHFISCME